MRNLEKEVIEQMSVSLAVAYGLMDGKDATTQSREELENQKEQIRQDHYEMAERVISTGV